MAIEDLELSNQNTQNQGLVPAQSYFHSNNSITAGAIKVKHPLMEES